MDYDLKVILKMDYNIVRSGGTGSHLDDSRVVLEHEVAVRAREQAQVLVVGPVNLFFVSIRNKLENATVKPLPAIYGGKKKKEKKT